jgi:UDP-3-O-[3-hydroxymyristoyl] glucosamine N-acyltransferase
MKKIKLSELSHYLEQRGFSNQIDGSDDFELFGVNTLDEAVVGEISFLSNSKYKQQLISTKASVVIVSHEEVKPEQLTVLRCTDPYAVMAAAVMCIHGVRKHPQWGIDSRTQIASSAQIGSNANIAPFVTIDENVIIGDNVILYSGCYIGNGAVLGDNVTLYPNVVIYDGCRIGNRVSLHANTVIGQDGLGYAAVDGRWMKIPQAGRAVVEDDVDMGACCAIDRATLGETRVGEGTKFSDAVVLGHGTKVGKHGMFVAQVGLAGSVTVGDHVTIGGQVGVAGHLSIGDNVVIGAKTGVWGDLEANERYFGIPAFKWKQFWRQVAAVKELPDALRKLRRLEKELETLKAGLKNDE